MQLIYLVAVFLAALPTAYSDIVQCSPSLAKDAPNTVKAEYKKIKDEMDKIAGKSAAGWNELEQKYSKKYTQEAQDGAYGCSTENAVCIKISSLHMCYSEDTNTIHKLPPTVSMDLNTGDVEILKNFDSPTTKFNVYNNTRPLKYHIQYTVASTEHREKGLGSLDVAAFNATFEVSLAAESAATAVMMTAGGGWMATFAAAFAIVIA